MGRAEGYDMPNVNIIFDHSLHARRMKDLMTWRIYSCLNDSGRYYALLGIG